MAAMDLVRSLFILAVLFRHHRIWASDGILDGDDGMAFVGVDGILVGVTVESKGILEKAHDVT